MRQCNRCLAYMHGNDFYVSGVNGKVAWSKDKMFTRICVYAQSKHGSEANCINESNTIVPSETIEYRTQEIERGLDGL